ncbi:glycerophosphodiester phosphodiesterase [Gracilibacillus sp. S3-1-1]|uniref:Glycerophosphodiester phosphodiesterase n=1 Tax=Gracilibacillus pellucidus TaxID=3095368 RepID=A0ACC6M699_9BACI|nr:glycerophosphodiester phosphodiesterase [Gracilibacillus sp. S3-1-1]MDX8046500.1 glycerophosphodiester phosphodiesterase [Gracilibacillus sp. S3-1-1]
MTKIFGHRGSKGKYPENTLRSFQAALEEGADGLELDVHLTKDGEVIVIHDEALDRTTDGHGQIKDLTLEEIKQYSAGKRFPHFNKYDTTWDKERVPTLAEVLQLLSGTDIALNIELKTYIYTYPGIEEKLFSVVNEYGENRKIVYSSFHLPSLIRMKGIDPDADIALLLFSPISNPQDYIQTFDFESLHVAKDLLLQDTHKLFQDLYTKTRVWTVNDEEEILQLLKMGVNTIITDYPEKAVKLKKQNL